MWKRLDRAIAYSKKFPALSDVGFRVWVHVLPYSDCEGRFSADPVVIKAQCLVRYSYRLEQIQEVLTELSSIGLLHLYDHGSEKYLLYHDHAEFNPPGRLKNQKPEWPFPASVKCKCVADRRAHGVAHADCPSVPSCLVSSVSSGGSGGPEPPKLCKLCSNSKLTEITLVHERHGESKMHISCPECEVDNFQTALERQERLGWQVPEPKESDRDD